MSNNFVKGAVYGHIVGDAVGFPLKNISVLPKYFDMYGTSTFPSGTYSDASAMMLCTMAAINESHSIIIEEIVDKPLERTIREVTGTDQLDVSDIL